jgi:hypothetical protein
MNRFVAALAACLIMFVPALVLAQPAVDVKYNKNGTLTTPLLDASGIIRMTEEYPFQLQNDAFPAADTSNTVINGVLRPVGLGWSVSPFGARTVLVTRVQKGTPNTLKLYLFGSDDNVNYIPILSSDVWSYTNNDSTKIDTLGVTIPTLFAGPNTVRQFKLSLPEAIYPGRYVQIWAMRTDSAYATNAMHLGLTYEGRWK